MVRRVGTAAALAAATTLALVAGACSPAGSAGNPSQDSTGGGTASGPSGTFVVARTQDIDKLDPQLATAFQTIEMLGLVYDSLVRTDTDGKLVGGLATKWSVTDAGKAITFDLRQGVTWQNGDPFTSADVKASLGRILDEKTGAVARSNLTSITGVTTPDDHTAVLHLTEPNTAIFYALASTNAAIVHADDIEAGTVGKEPDGTGPFAFKEWDQGQQVVLTGNPHYWGGSVSIGKLVFRVIPSDASILSGMRAGAFQLGILSDPSVAHQAEGGTGFKLDKQPTMSYAVLMLNGRRPPLDNLKVRQAIACAVDRQQVIATAAGGDGKVTGPITSAGYQYSPTDGLPCKPGDISAAKALLTAAGYPDGLPRPLTTPVMTGSSTPSVAIAQNLQAQLAKIGVRLSIKQMATSPYVSAWLKADFDVTATANGGSSDPYLMYGRYFTSGGSLTKPAGLSSKTLNDLLATGNSTDDEQVRQATYKQLQEELLRQSPWVWLFAPDAYYLVSDKVSGFAPRTDESLISLATTGAS